MRRSTIRTTKNLASSAKAKEGSATLIACVLANLDQDGPAFTKDLRDSVEKYFHLGPAFENDGAWEVLKARFDIAIWKGFNEQAYGAELGNAKGNGDKIWNMVYD
jgi:hypothetical protein